MTELDPKELEAVAAVEHEQWAHWTRYMLDNLGPENIEHWKRQIKTAYSELPEAEKRSDREWATKAITAYQSAQESDDEPSAWRYRTAFKGGIRPIPVGIWEATTQKSFMDDAEAYGFDVEPLYIHPPQESVPVSDEMEISEALKLLEDAAKWIDGVVQQGPGDHDTHVHAVNIRIVKAALTKGDADE